MRQVELAFIDRSDPEVDRVTVIPPDSGSAARRSCRTPHLPVDVVASSSTCGTPVSSTPMTGRAPIPPRPDRESAGNRRRGAGGQRHGSRSRRSTSPPSTSRSSGRTDRRDPRHVARHAVVQGHRPRTTGHSTSTAASYDFTLRFARTYKPYAIELVEFRHDKYVGTETPKNFSSLVRRDRAGEGASIAPSRSG